MKVLMIAPQPWFSPRGTPLSVLHRLRTLSKLGHEIDLVTYPIGEDVPIPNVRIFRTARVPFFNQIEVGPSKRKVIFDWLIYRKAKQLLRQNKYDVLHTHEEAGFFGPHLAKKFGMLHLYDMHSSLPQQLRNFNYTSLKPVVNTFEKLERNTITKAQAVITICPELHTYVKELFPDKFNMLLENVAYDTDAFPEDDQKPEAIRRQYALENKTVILYAGTFEHYQGLDLLIESSKKVLAEQPDVIYFLVGGKPHQVEKYQKMAADFGVSDNFIFTGTVKPGAVPGYVAMADILVTPRIEGNNTPLKIYSYLRSGKPVVATRHLTHTQVLDENVAILADVNPDAFAEGTLKVVTDKKLRETVAKAALELAEEKYSYPVYVEKTRKVYEHLEKHLNA